MTSKKRPSAGTELIHSAPRPAQGEPFTPGPVFASTFVTAGDPATSPYQYGRYGNPTWDVLETALGKLEQGVVRIFPSGAAAISAAMLALCRPGDTVVLPADAYFGTRKFATTWMERWGLSVRFVPTTAMAEADYTGVQMVFIETPSNPGLDVCDIRTTVANAHDAGALVAVDNTTATPLGQLPLALGADLSISSDSKMINGHSDVVFGHIAAVKHELVDQITAWRTQSGCIPGPMETWLVQRGLATLELRHARQSSSAQKVAEYLRDHAVVKHIRYPGLATDPAHAIARQQMRSFGSVISFELASEAAAQRFLAAEGLILEATSFGGVHTMAERRARWQGDEVPPNAIRLSVGCEPVDDLIEQLEHSLQAAADSATP